MYPMNPPLGGAFSPAKSLLPLHLAQHLASNRLPQIKEFLPGILKPPPQALANVLHRELVRLEPGRQLFPSQRRGDRRPAPARVEYEAIAVAPRWLRR